MASSAGEQTGRVVAIAIRTGVKLPMREVDRALVTADRGIEGDIKVAPQRGITFIDKRQWTEVTRELEADLPWHTRRANVLVEGLVMADLIGKRIRVGSVEVQINAETKPCGLMDELHPGLRKALVPDCRGGAYGRVVRAGEFRPGDTIEVLSPEAAMNSGSPRFLQTSEHVAFAADKLRKHNLLSTPQLACDVYCVSPGQEQAGHSHDGQAKLYYVIEGEGFFTVGDETQRLGPGGLAWAASGEPHGVRNESQQNLVLLVAIAPNPNIRRGV